MGIAVAPHMGHADAAAVVAISAAVVVLLALTHSNDAFCYLLAFPIWIVSRDLGVLPGAAVAALALLFVVVDGAGSDGGFGPLGYVALAAVLVGVVAAGGQAARPRSGDGTTPRSALLRVLTTRPEITRGAETLSSRELDVLEMIATGAKNAEIAERFVISQNTVKSHVGHILKKLPAKNRTAAAFRYIELYGAPTSSAEDSAATNGDVKETREIGATGASTAAVSELLRNDRLLLRLQDGQDLEVPLVEQIRGRVDVGSDVIVYFDQHNRAVGWYLPDEEIGLDLRSWAP